MKIVPVSSIISMQYKNTKEKKDNHQKEFVDVVDDLTNYRKCGIIKLGNYVDIKI